jgi:hypothetical protein
MKRIMVSLVTSGCLVVGLSGCGDGGGDAVLGGQGPAEAPPRPTKTTSAVREGGAGQPVANVPDQLCSFLSTEVPRLKGKDSHVKAVAGFVVDYTRWVARDPNRVVESASELDAISLARCPTVRREVLGLLDRDSLGKVLNR